MLREIDFFLLIGFKKSEHVRKTIVINKEDMKNGSARFYFLSRSSNLVYGLNYNLLYYNQATREIYKMQRLQRLQRNRVRLELWLAI